MKAYLNFPFLSSWQRRRPIENLPISAGLVFNWSDYDFQLCDDESYYPRGSKKGTHKFSITIGLMWWAVVLTFYIPDKDFVPVVYIPTPEEQIAGIKAAYELLIKNAKEREEREELAGKAISEAVKDAGDILNNK